MFKFLKSRMPLDLQRKTAENLALDLTKFAEENGGTPIPPTILVQMATISFDMFGYRRTEEDIKNVIMMAFTLTNVERFGLRPETLDDAFGSWFNGLANEPSQKPTPTDPPAPSEEELKARLASLNAKLRDKGIG